jgi:hypothetical protein
MSRDHTFRIARPSMTLRSLAGVFAGILCAGAVALAQNGKPVHPGVAPHSLFAQREQPPPPKKPPVRPTPARPAPAQATPVRPAQPQQQSTPQPEQRPIPQRQLPQAQAATTPLIIPNRPGQTQMHLGPWMQAHSNLPLAQQQAALENESGFRALPPQEQQRLHQRLTQLNNMPPEQRERAIARAEAMERLTPVQQRQVTNAMAQIGNLPEYRQHVVDRAFLQLRDMPAGQRQAYMNSLQFRAQFNEQERGAINGLLDITPIWPPIQAHPPDQR